MEPKTLQDHTIAEAKEQIQLGHQLAAEMGIDTPVTELAATIESRSSIYDSMIGKYAIIRSRNEGINAGEITAADSTGVVLKDARRICYHRPADNTSWYEGVANSGLRKESRISATVAQKIIIESYSATPCSAVAEKSIRGFAAHEQTGND